MAYTDEPLSLIFDRTDGRCHLCGLKLCLGNYGRFGRRGAWEVEHSNSHCNGGHTARRSLRVQTDPVCVNHRQSGFPFSPASLPEEIEAFGLAQTGWACLVLGDVKIGFVERQRLDAQLLTSQISVPPRSRASNNRQLANNLCRTERASNCWVLTSFAPEYAAR
jgi:hypothetical protein